MIFENLGRELLDWISSWIHDASCNILVLFVDLQDVSFTFFEVTGLEFAGIILLVEFRWAMD